MVPVPSYQLIPFLAWLHHHRVRLAPEQLEHHHLRELAYEFLRTHGSLDGSPLTSTLGGIMWVFQTCAMINEQTVEEQMQHFAGCGQCMEVGHVPAFPMSDDRGCWPAGPGVGPQSLHPLLRAFVAQHSDGPLAQLVHNWTQRLEPELSRTPEHAFRQLMREIGPQLRDAFGAYLQLAREHRPELIEDYERWRKALERRKPADEQRDDRLHEPDTHPIRSDDAPEQAAERLAESASLAIRSGFYDQITASQPEFARLLSLVADTPENLGQVLEFLNWITKREPDLDLRGSIPGSVLEALALDFCEDAGFSNGPTFAKTARKYLSGQGPSSAIDRIARFLGLWRQTVTRSGRETRNPLDRYGRVPFHGMFLFLAAGDFPGFIEKNWRDLHHLTGEDLDIYYSKQDLSERTSGYETVEQLRSLKIRADGLPAFLLWRDSLDDAVTIPLHELEHDAIVEVMKSVVQAIRDRIGLPEIAKVAFNKALSLRRKSASMLVESGATLVINNGGVMGDKYTNTGIAGAMGANPHVHDNIFMQEARSALSEVQLTPEYAATLTGLSESLAGRKDVGLRLEERLAGAQHLAALANAAKTGANAEEHVSGWRKWVASLGERSATVLSVLANVTTIATPIAKILGLPL